VGRFSDFERKVDEVAELSEVERKAVRTWFVATLGLTVILWLSGRAPYRVLTGYDWCRSYGNSPEFCNTVRTNGADYRWDWTPTLQLVATTTVVLAMFIAYVRIWKRPDES
jgi:hypothetical protein